MKLTGIQKHVLRMVNNNQMYQYHLMYRNELNFLISQGLISLSFDNIRTTIDKPIYVLTIKGREYIE